jgi:hypothetical protein
MTTTLTAPALQETSPGDDQILEVFAEFGRPNDEQCTMTYNAPQIVAAVRALLCKLHAPVSYDQELSHLLEVAPRLQDLATRLVAAGPKAAHVSTSETHEISDFVNATITLLPKLRAQAAGDDEGWQQYRLRGSNETAKQIIERERDAYARLLHSVLAKSRGSAQLSDIRAELNRLGMMAHTAMNQNSRDMRNIMEDMSDRLLALAGDASVASPLASGGAAAWFDPKGDNALWKELLDAKGEDNHTSLQASVPLARASAKDVDAVIDAIRSAGYRDHPTNIERKRVDAILATVTPLLRKLCAPIADSAALRDLLAERARQINVEGFSLERDDAYTDGELAQAAACYAASSQSRDISYMSHLWPWANEWWKPGTTREDLLKAGALVLAEIERIDRARAAMHIPECGKPLCSMSEHHPLCKMHVQHAEPTVGKSGQDNGQAVGHAVSRRVMSPLQLLVETGGAIESSKLGDKMLYRFWWPWESKRLNDWHDSPEAAIEEARRHVEGEQ